MKTAKPSRFGKPDSVDKLFSRQKQEYQARVQQDIQAAQAAQDQLLKERYAWELRAPRLQPTAEAVIYKALDFEQNGQLEAASELLHKLLVQQPDMEQARRLQGRILQKIHLQQMEQQRSSREGAVVERVQEPVDEGPFVVGRETISPRRMRSVGPVITSKAQFMEDLKAQAREAAARKRQQQMEEAAADQKLEEAARRQAAAAKAQAASAANERLGQQQVLRQQMSDRLHGRRERYEQQRQEEAELAVATRNALQGNGELDVLRAAQHGQHSMARGSGRSQLGETARRRGATPGKTTAPFARPGVDAPVPRIRSADVKARQQAFIDKRTKRPSSAHWS